MVALIRGKRRPKTHGYDAYEAEFGAHERPAREMGLRSGGIVSRLREIYKFGCLGPLRGQSAV